MSGFWQDPETGYVTDGEGWWEPSEFVAMANAVEAYEMDRDCGLVDEDMSRIEKELGRSLYFSEIRAVGERAAEAYERNEEIDTEGELERFWAKEGQGPDPNAGEEGRVMSMAQRIEDHQEREAFMNPDVGPTSAPPSIDDEEARVNRMAEVFEAGGYDRGEAA